ncbi:MAG: glycosyltransferase family 4 protein [Planctomycetota bacterium]|nr:glycosyltransferase family 4 protein [Planctomycetota bacterium]
MHIALITAGGAGMFCGSCMHDNTLARALMASGHRVTLIPLYTPIRVDELDVSEHRVFLGGVNVYLAGLWPWWSRVPRFLRAWLDRPAVLRFVSRFAVSSDAKDLGGLTVALLRGDDGPHRAEIEEFVKFIGDELKPDVVVLSNALLGGVVPSLKRRFSGAVWCLLQGDDIFLGDLVEPYRSQAFELMYQIVREIDGFLVHSEYYRQFMADYLRFPADKAKVVPLGIDLAGHDGVVKTARESGSLFTVGYFARICPEKGLHNLVHAFRILHAKHPQTRLVAAGYLGARDQAWFDDLKRSAEDLAGAFEYQGSPPDHLGKVAFLKSVDVLSVPTTYREPKGLYVLEALANGVPVVQPGHGSFPELIEATGGGLLVEPDDPGALADGLERLLLDEELRHRLADTGRQRVRERFTMSRMAEETARVLDIRPGSKP